MTFYGRALVERFAFKRLHYERKRPLIGSGPDAGMVPGTWLGLATNPAHYTANEKGRLGKV